MYLRANHRGKDGKEHVYWSLVETVRTSEGPRQKTVCYLGEVAALLAVNRLPADDPQVARVVLNKVRLERTRQFGACYLGLELWKQLELGRFFEQVVDGDPADVPWSQCAHRAANWRLKSAGIRPQLWMIRWESRKARSTIRDCTGVWTASCRTRRNWSGI